MRFQSAAFISIVLLAAVGCGNKEPEPTTGPGKTGDSGTLRIAVIPKGTTHEFWKAIHAGAEDAAKEMGASITWKGPLKEDDKVGQVGIVEDFVVQKVSGIVLAPLDDSVMRAPVADAKAKGVPVVIIDSGLNSKDYVSFVATDNEKGGQLAAQKMIELLGGKGKVVMMRYQAGSASTDLREKGFLEGIKAAPGIQVVSDNIYGGATTESAQGKAENILSPLKTAGGLSIDGIFCPNESTTFGMLRYLQDAGLAGKVKFIGFDSSAKLVEALKAGQINGLVVQNPYKMGYLGVKTMIDHLKGKTVEPRVDTGVTVVTKENMDSPESKKLLTPKQL